MSEPERQLGGEPTAVYLDRTAQERAKLTEPHALEEARRAVLDLVDTDPTHHHEAVAAYLASSPGVTGVRAAERVVRHLVAHPLLDSTQRETLAGLFNDKVSYYRLDTCPNKKRRVTFLEPTLIALVAPVDDMAEVS